MKLPSVRCSDSMCGDSRVRWIGGAVDRSRDKLANLDAVPVLAGEGVDGLLLKTLLSLGKSLVLSYGHPVLYRSLRSSS